MLPGRRVQFGDLRQLRQYLDDLSDQPVRVVFEAIARRVVQDAWTMLMKRESFRLMPRHLPEQTAPPTRAG